MSHHGHTRRTARAGRHRHRATGLGVAAGALLATALTSVASAPDAQADPELGGPELGGPELGGPELGPPILISCVIGVGCTETPITPPVDTVHDPIGFTPIGPVDGARGADPFDALFSGFPADIPLG